MVGGVVPGLGNDQFGGRGHDRCDGRSTNLIRGGDDGETNSGPNTRDKISGGDGDDRPFGGLNSGYLVGGAGNDHLAGGLIRDHIHGALAMPRFSPATGVIAFLAGLATAIWIRGTVTTPCCMRRAMVLPISWAISRTLPRCPSPTSTFGPSTGPCKASAFRLDRRVTSKGHPWKTSFLPSTSFWPCC